MSAARKQPRSLVVDASVARSAGGEEARAAQSAACRDALKAISRSSLHVVITPAILKEWRKHRSKFAYTWLNKMRGSRRVRKLNPPAHQEIRSALRHLPGEQQRAAVIKDLLLVEAAIASDHRVLSQDDAVRGHLAILIEHVHDLAILYWANPIQVNCILWLEQGARDEEAFLLATLYA